MKAIKSIKFLSLLFLFMLKECLCKLGRSSGLVFFSFLRYCIFLFRSVVSYLKTSLSDLVLSISHLFTFSSNSPIHIFIYSPLHLFTYSPIHMFPSFFLFLSFPFCSHFHSAEENLNEYESKRPQTGFYANKNPARTILVDGRFFSDPPGK